LLSFFASPLTAFGVAEGTVGSFGVLALALVIELMMSSSALFVEVGFGGGGGGAAGIVGLSHVVLPLAS